MVLILVGKGPSSRVKFYFICGFSVYEAAERLLRAHNQNSGEIFRFKEPTIIKKHAFVFAVGKLITLQIRLQRSSI